MAVILSYGIPFSDLGWDISWDNSNTSMRDAHHRGNLFPDRGKESATTKDNPSEQEGGVVAFQFGAPDPSLLSHFHLIQQAAEKEAAASDAWTSLQYGPVSGSPDCLASLASFLNRQYTENANVDYHVKVDHLFLTSGASQSFSNIITLFTNPQTIFLMENPTYFLALRILQDHGITGKAVKPIRTDDAGLDVDDLERILLGLLEKSRESSSTTPLSGPKRFPFLLYLVPSYSNPTGRTLTLQRRMQLLEIARKHDVLIVADDMYHALYFTTVFSGTKAPMTPPPRLVALETRLSVAFGNVISNGSFSKIFGPGIRLGWIEAGAGIIRQLRNAGLSYSGGSPNHTMSVLISHILSANQLDVHIENLRQVLTNRGLAMHAYLVQHLPASVFISLPSGGYFIWIELPKLSDLDTVDLLAHINAKTDGCAYLGKQIPHLPVSFTPGNMFSSDGSHENCIRLSFAYYDTPVLLRGCELLCRIINALLS